VEEGVTYAPSWMPMMLGIAPLPHNGDVDDSKMCEQHICCDPLGEQCSNGAKCECVSAKEERQRRLLFGSIPKDDCFCAAPTPTKRKYNILWMLIDDVSVERFPESGNTALEGLLPGFDELKADGAIFYDNLYAPSSICAPAQASIFSGMDPGRIGAHHQFAGDNIEGLREYKSTPPPEVEFMPEILRQAEFGSGLVQECGSVWWPLLSPISTGLLSPISTGLLSPISTGLLSTTSSLPSSAGGLLVDWCRQAGLSSWRRECRLSFSFVSE
jgi:hypothetical protein